MGFFLQCLQCWPQEFMGLYILLVFPFVFVLALHWWSLLQSLPNSIAVFRLAVIAEDDFPEKEISWLIYKWCEISERPMCLGWKQLWTWSLDTHPFHDVGNSQSVCVMSQAKVHWDLDQSCSVFLFSWEGFPMSKCKVLDVPDLERGPDALRCLGGLGWCCH